jgi:hypothetical protein
MGSPDASQRAAAEQWFLDRGLPSVLRPGALARRLWTRSAPALAAFAVMMAFSIVIVLFTGKHTIDIEGRPTRTQWFVLAAAMLVLPSAGAVGWWCHGSIWRAAGWSPPRYPWRLRSWGRSWAAQARGSW